jgi:hypothetical protein
MSFPNDEQIRERAWKYSARSFPIRITLVILPPASRMRTRPGANSFAVGLLVPRMERGVGFGVPMEWISV